MTVSKSVTSFYFGLGVCIYRTKTGPKCEGKNEIQAGTIADVRLNNHNDRGLFYRAVDLVRSFTSWIEFNGVTNSCEVVTISYKVG